jgi:serine protease
LQGTIIAEGGNNKGIVGIIPDNQNMCLLIARVFGEDGTQSFSVIHQAAEWCGDNGARVINMSLGGRSKSIAGSQIYQELRKEGVLVVAAAGNAGDTLKEYPASYDDVLSVAATNDLNERAGFSQFNDQVNLSAPGVQILSTTAGTGAQVSDNGGTVFRGDIIMAFSAIGDGFISQTEVVDCQQAFEPCSNAVNKVCVIERGETSFAEKAVNCKEGGGVAALIYNNEEGGSFGNLGETYNGLSIPVIGLSRENGLALLETNSVSISMVTGGSAELDGTSMASPHVAGVAAKIWAARPQCTNEQVREALLNTALDLGDAGRDDMFGSGLVQAVDAYNYLLAFEPPCGGAIPTETLPNSPPISSCTVSFGECSDNSECCSNRCIPLAIGDANRICRSAPKANKAKLTAGHGGGGQGGGRKRIRGRK